ncbi:MAG: hypothetical protein HY754_15380 [Nitrospirae bacterium]|nr:hypothetical protein [Nitrospirota bacterium]
MSIKLLSSVLLSAMLMFVSTQAFADYKIILKNGREFIVDNYKETGGKIKFYREGGEIELDKGNIEEIKQVKDRKKKEDTPSVEGVKKETTAETSPAGKSEAAGSMTGNENLRNRLNEIAKKKEEIKAAGDKLSEEKRKLTEDIKKEGQVTYYREVREYEHKISELEEKIRKHNEELDRLEQEQARILREAESQRK